MQTPGWDAFVQNSSSTLQELQESYDLFLDVADFTTHSKQALKDITISIVDFKVKQRCHLDDALLTKDHLCTISCRGTGT
jgi:hypothetical protein